MTTDDNEDTVKQAATASLEILTGPARGTVSWLAAATLDVSLNDDDMIRVAEAGGNPLQDGIVARLHRSGDSYEIEGVGQNPLWINGERFDSRHLEPRDLIEFGDKGPLSRFRLHRQGDFLRRSLGEMLNDAIDYSRVSRRPRLERFTRALGDLLADFALRTTLLFRAGVIVALAILTYIAFLQYRAGIEFQQQAETRAHQLEDFARSLTRTSEEALKPADLNRLRQELSHSLSNAEQRLKSLEIRSEANRRVIAAATRSVMFLQGSYGFIDAESLRMLRYQVDEDGNPVFSARGQPLLTLAGEGEIASSDFTGTGFLVSPGGALLTNRHVAQPWEDAAGLEMLLLQGLEPVVIRLRGFVPGAAEAIPLKMLAASEETDLALLVCVEIAGELPHLKLGDQLPEPGDEVIVMGYPTGLRAMLAQTGDSFLAELEQDGRLDIWEVTERLARSDFIRPLASRGIVGQRSESTVIYDADTTHGGSGGPVLDVNGRVIAINTAFIPEYGGSNIGIPIKLARRLLSDAGIVID